MSVVEHEFTMNRVVVDSSSTVPKSKAWARAEGAKARYVRGRGSGEICSESGEHEEDDALCAESSMMVKEKG